MIFPNAYSHPASFPFCERKVFAVTTALISPPLAGTQLVAGTGAASAKSQAPPQALNATAPARVNADCKNCLRSNGFSIAESPNLANSASIGLDTPAAFHQLQVREMMLVFFPPMDQNYAR